jgi:PII-like signaling protein
MAEQLLDATAASGIRSAVLLRGREGFGASPGFQVDGRLTLAENLPMALFISGPESRVLALGRQFRLLLGGGLVAMETSRQSHESDQNEPGSRLSRLSIWTGRQARIEGGPAHVGLVKFLREHGAEAAISMLGVDGLSAGARERARFFSSNRRVPMMVTAVVHREAIPALRANIHELLPGATLEELDLCQPKIEPVAETGPSGMWKISIYGGGSAAGSGIHQQREILGVLRRMGAAGATGYSGVYGFQGDELPHGDSFLAIRRRLPTLTEVIDTAANCRRWLEEIDRLSGSPAVVTISQVRVINRPADQA